MKLKKISGLFGLSLFAAGTLVIIPLASTGCSPGNQNEVTYRLRGSQVIAYDDTLIITASATNQNGRFSWEKPDDTGGVTFAESGVNNEVLSITNINSTLSDILFPASSIKVTNNGVEKAVTEVISCSVSLPPNSYRTSIDNGKTWTFVEDFTGTTLNNLGTEITNLETNLPDLLMLHCGHNDITGKLNLSACTSLTELWCQHCYKLTGLTLPDSIEVLHCSNSYITGILDLSACTSLTELHCEGIYEVLTEIDLPRYTQMTTIDIYIDKDDYSPRKIKYASTTTILDFNGSTTPPLGWTLVPYQNP